MGERKREEENRRRDAALIIHAGMRHVEKWGTKLMMDQVSCERNGNVRIYSRHENTQANESTCERDVHPPPVSKPPTRPTP